MIKKERRAGLRRQTPKAWQETVRELSSLRHALEVSSIFAITHHTGEIIYVNDKYCDVSRYSRREIIGRDHKIFNSAHHPPEFFKNLWETVLSGHVWHGVVRDRAKDGTIFWLDTTIVPLLTAQKKPYQFVCIRHEVTKMKEMEAAIATLPQKILQAQETERARISREIHDDLGQSLVTLKMMIQAHFHHGFQGPCGRERIRVVNYIDDIIAKTRALAVGLRPSTLEVLGLTTSLKSLVHDFRQAHDVRIFARFVSLDGLNFKGEAINLYRIIQEALTNVISHARAKNVWLNVRKRAGVLIVTIKDDGKGFPASKKKGHGGLAHGLGLSTMQERAKLLQGKAMIDSLPGRGVVVKLEVPYE